MEDAIQKFKQLSELAEKQKSNRDRIKGSMDQIAKTLKQKGFNNLAAAITKMKSLSKEKATKEILIKKKIKEFEEKYAEHLQA